MKEKAGAGELCGSCEGRMKQTTSEKTRRARPLVQSGLLLEHNQRVLELPLDTFSSLFARSWFP